nr:ABC transporter permease [Corynebacterium sp. TAE3-ERU12]
MAAPILFFICFHVPLNESMPEYANFLVPTVIMQAVMFTAILAAQNAGRDVSGAVQDRLMTLPIPRMAPAVARLIAMVVRTTLAIFAAFFVATLFGFRFRGDALDAVALFLLPLLFAVGVSMLTDALGQAVPEPDSVGQVLMVPQMLLVMMSVGIVPEAGFPEWIQPLVRNQPLSQMIIAMRGWIEGTDVNLTPVVLWLIGLFVAGIAALYAASHREARR